MKRFIPIFIVLLFSNICCSQNNADEIIYKLLEAQGGFKAYSDLTTRVDKGTFTFISDSVSFNGTFIRYHKSPYLYSRIMIINEGTKCDTVYSGSNNKVTWTFGRRSGYREKPFDNPRNIMVPPIYFYKDDFKTYRLSGNKNVDGKNTYEIILNENESTERFWYIDVDTYMLIKSARNTSENNIERYSVFTFEDVRELSGLKFSFLNTETIRIDNKIGKYTWITESIDLNVPIPESVFEAPK